MYKAVILDIDGTLVDSNEAHAQAWVRALSEHGHDVPYERVRPLIGMGSDKLLPALVGVNVDSPEGAAIAERRRKIFERDYIDRLRPQRGAQALLEWLRDDGLRLVVATSAEASEVHDLLRIAGAAKLVDAETSSEDVERSKPHPDVVEAAIAQTRCATNDVVMLGDTPYDIKAGLRAGVGVIAMRCGGWWADSDLAGALAIYDDPQDLLDHYDLSPFKRRLPVSRP